MLSSRANQPSSHAVPLLILLQLLAFYISSSSQTCSFTVDNDGTPRAVSGAEAVPSVHIYTSKFICADLFPGENCCNDYQNNQMASNFLQIDATFGSIGGGCDFCGSNLKRFWCTYTCHPQQASFTTILPNKVVVPNPLDEGATTLSVMGVQIVVNSQTVCDVWSSCNLTPYATQVSAMQTPAGFLSFQGQNAVTQASQTISVSYTSDENTPAITLNNVSECNLPQPDVDKFANKTYPFYPDQYGFNISTVCTCNNCEAACTAQTFVALPVMEGFSWLAVGLMYGFIILVTVGCCLLRKQKLNQKRRARREQLENAIEDNNDNYQRIADDN